MWRVSWSGVLEVARLLAIEMSDRFPVVQEACEVTWRAGKRALRNERLVSTAKTTRFPALSRLRAPQVSLQSRLSCVEIFKAAKQLLGRDDDGVIRSMCAADKQENPIIRRCEEASETWQMNRSPRNHEII